MDQLAFSRKRLKSAAATRCQNAIYEGYDKYAQENIANLRLNLDTGEHYTEEDRDEMNSFIDAKRARYKELKDQIDAQETREDLYNLDLSY